MMATQALQYNNITVSKNEFLRYSVTVTVLQFLKSKTALMSLTRPSDILFVYNAYSFIGNHTDSLGL